MVVVVAVAIVVVGALRPIQQSINCCFAIWALELLVSEAHSHPDDDAHGSSTMGATWRMLMYNGPVSCVWLPATRQVTMANRWPCIAALHQCRLTYNQTPLKETKIGMALLPAHNVKKTKLV